MDFSPPISRTPRRLNVALALSLAALLGGCGDEPITSEDVSKPLDGVAVKQGAAVSMPDSHPLVPGAGPINMRAQSLPASAMSQAGNPTWAVPQHWQAGPQSSMRRGSWSVAGENGATADISVTVFPGDVGGMLQNVNRWRGQIGLLPMTSANVDEAVSDFEADGKRGYLAELRGGTDSTIAVGLEAGGSTWFFKITGPSALVQLEKEAFLAFLRSVDFPDAE